MEEEEAELLTDNPGESESEGRLPENGSEISSTYLGAQREEISENMIKVKETASSSESKSYSEHINEKMIKAAESGDHEDVSRALEEGAEIKQTNKQTNFINIYIK